MRMYNSVGCQINGEFNEKELKRFYEAGWMTEEKYKELHPEEFEE